MNEYCTLFNKKYLIHGIQLYESLRAHSPKFKLFVLAMDSEVENFFKANIFPEITILKFQDLKNRYLKEYQRPLSVGQICWVSEPLVCKYIFDVFGVKEITYLDADVYFYSNPEPLFNELKGCSAAIVPHNFSRVSYASSSGNYCVQFNYFKNNSIGGEILNKWIADCRGYDLKKPHFYPGQLSMDSWTEQWPSDVHVIKNIGAGVAPWNVSAYKINEKNGELRLDGERLIFYHFHQLARLNPSTFFISGYGVNLEVVELIYKKYLKGWSQTKARYQLAEDHEKKISYPRIFDDKKIDLNFLKKFSDFKKNLYQVDG